MTNKKEWLKFVEVFPDKPRKTKVFQVFHIGGDALGYIVWCCGWRQYVHETDGFLIFSSSCYKQLSKFIDELMTHRKIDKMFKSRR